uniref:Uncharacterized protein n=1 Tax=Cajanus cajan TaxID=3821 RepID=A0A151UBH1_CAJCA|nr:hypothetical protein KK1_020916 [Cajanus cajan]
MGHLHHHHGSNHHIHHQKLHKLGGGDSPYDDPFLNSCCCFLATSYIFIAFQRCILLPCYSFFKCFGWNDTDPRYHHYIHHLEME